MVSICSPSSLSLTAQYDDIVSCTNVLLPGTEGAFAQFVGSKIFFSSKLSTLTDENKDMKLENDALQIKLKHARSSFDYQMQKRIEAEEGLKQYEKQFTIILELLGDNKLNSLSNHERRSLAKLKDNKKSFSPMSFTESSAVVSTSDISIDPLDLDMDVSKLRDGKQWKRRRTHSTDKVAKAASPPNKKKKSNDGAATSPREKDNTTTNGRSSLSPIGELHKVPPLDQYFKKPPPNKNRRRPSQGHLKQLAAQSEDDIEDPIYSLLDTSRGVECDDDPPPSAPPISSKIYPVLPDNSSDVMVTSPVMGVAAPAFSTPTSSPLPNSQSDFNMQRLHTFFMKTIIKLETITCDVCNKKIKFSKNCLKCRDCRTVCHPDCKDQVPLPCIPTVPTPKKKQTSDLASHCPHSIPRVPGIVVHCINEIEKRGLCTVGLYRVPGSSKAIKEVKERILKAKGNPGLDKVSDINVICGVLSNFLKSLREPILTFRMHLIFIKAAECEASEDSLASTLEAIAQLPPANKDTLAFIILHLQRVASHCDSNKMPLTSLANIFGPSIVGHASAHPKDDVMLEDARKQPKVMARLLGISGDYWRQYMSETDNPEPSSYPSPTPSVISSPGLRSPATPELRPIPESPFLGSCQSPKSKTSRTPHVMPRPGSRAYSTAGERPKRAGKFFAALD